ncbi:MAG: hypothetical protein ACK4WM_06635 [Thermoflexales bacterium]
MATEGFGAVAPAEPACDAAAEAELLLCFGTSDGCARSAAGFVLLAPETGLFSSFDGGIAVVSVM